MPTFCTHAPYFSPFSPPKWEKPPNRSLSGGTVRARGRNQHQPSRGIKTAGVEDVAGAVCLRRNQHQPSRGIKTYAGGLIADTQIEPESTSTQSRD